ncbi:hypothetical protein D9M73_121140 [compost metagenome]
MISVPFLARRSRSSATAASRATDAASPRIATELELVTATTLALEPVDGPPPPAPCPVSACNAVAISRAPAFFNATMRVAAVSVSIWRITSRTRRTLSAKSTMTRLFPPRLAVTEPCGEISPRTVSTAEAASIERKRTISVT